MVLLPVKIHRCHVNVVFIGRQTGNLRSRRCRRDPTVEIVDTFFFTQSDPSVRVFVKHATLSRLTFDADTNALGTGAYSEIHAICIG